MSTITSGADSSLFTYGSGDTIKNYCGDELDPDFTLAFRFQRLLRERCLEADPKHLSSSITLHTNKTKQKLYVRGYSFLEVFIASIYDYLALSPVVDMIEFSIPRFSIESIGFNLKWDIVEKRDFNWDTALPPASQLSNCLRECYFRYHLTISQSNYVHKKMADDYLSTILVCQRKNIAPEVEDMIHQFAGRKPINQFNSVSAISKSIAKNNDFEQMDLEDLYRAWNSVNNMIY